MGNRPAPSLTIERANGLPNFFRRTTFRDQSGGTILSFMPNAKTLKSEMVTWRSPVFILSRKLSRVPIRTVIRHTIEVAIDEYEYENETRSAL